MYGAARGPPPCVNSPDSFLCHGAREQLKLGPLKLTLEAKGERGGEGFCLQGRQKRHTERARHRAGSARNLHPLLFKRRHSDAHESSQRGGRVSSLYRRSGGRAVRPPTPLRSPNPTHTLCTTNTLHTPCDRGQSSVGPVERKRNSKRQQETTSRKGASQTQHGGWRPCLLGGRPRQPQKYRTAAKHGEGKKRVMHTPTTRVQYEGGGQTGQVNAD